MARNVNSWNLPSRIMIGSSVALVWKLQSMTCQRSSFIPGFAGVWRIIGRSSSLFIWINCSIWCDTCWRWNPLLARNFPSALTYPLALITATRQILIACPTLTVRLKLSPILLYRPNFILKSTFQISKLSMKWSENQRNSRSLYPQTIILSLFSWKKIFLYVTSICPNGSMQSRKMEELLQMEWKYKKAKKGKRKDKDGIDSLNYYKKIPIQSTQNSKPSKFWWIHMKN